MGVAKIAKIIPCLENKSNAASFDFSQVTGVLWPSWPFICLFLE